MFLSLSHEKYFLIHLKINIRPSFYLKKKKKFLDIIIVKNQIVLQLYMKANIIYRRNHKMKYDLKGKPLKVILDQL